MASGHVGVVDHAAVVAAVRALLHAAGQDPAREGLAETPLRYAKFLAQWLDQPKPAFTTFDSDGMNEMVVQSGITFHALCEHHMLPFAGTATVGYLPNGRVVGLSKLARAVRWCARGFQNQERITRAVADLIQDEVKPRGVAVVLRAEHLCMSMRGVQAPGALTTTSDLRGPFYEDARCRAEFLALAGVRP